MQRYGKDKQKPQALKTCGKCLVQKLLPTIFAGHRELFAGVTTAGVQHAAAVGRGHASAETVLVHTLATGGLKCSLHDIYFYIFRVRTAKVVILNETAKLFFDVND